MSKWRAMRHARRSRVREHEVVTLTLAEADALRGAAGFGEQPTTPKGQAALDRAVAKCRQAHERLRRRRRSG